MPLVLPIFTVLLIRMSSNTTYAKSKEPKYETAVKFNEKQTLLRLKNFYEHYY